MILVDRFCRAEGATPAPQPPWHGGNLAGIRSKLDYLQDLGVSALWLSPVYRNQRDGCHGYWPVDFFAVDERFGTLAELRDLIGECHRRGLRVLLDMVLNHAGYDHPMARDPRYRGWFHRGGDIRWFDQRSIERGALHGLPDFAQEKPEVAQYLIDNCRWWQEQTGCDGFRLDAVKHVPAAFWKQFSAAMHAQAGPDFLLLGEVYRGVPSYIARYQREDGIDSVFDVPFADTVRSTLSHGSETPAPPLWRRLWQLRHEYRTMLLNEIMRRLKAGQPGNLRALAALHAADGAYVNPHLLATLIDNHDLSRFASEANRPERLRLALTLLLTWRGLPVLTYGTETGMRGRTDDGSNRAPLVFGADPELTAFVRTLIHLRRETPALTRGTQTEVHADRSVYVFVRDYGSERILVALNNAPRAQVRTVRLPAWQGYDGEWQPLLPGAAAGTATAGKLKLSLPARSALAWRASA